VPANAEALPFDDASVDGYTIAFGIRNVTHIDRALSEAQRVRWRSTAPNKQSPAGWRIHDCPCVIRVRVRVGSGRVRVRVRVGWLQSHLRACGCISLVCAVTSDVHALRPK
jgi:hypothetical protein